MRNSAKRAAVFGALLALSAALAVAESMIGALFPVPVPGVKLGIANIVSLFLLCCFSLSSALTISFLRTLLASLFFGGLGMFVYSAPGALLSTLAMYIALRRLKSLSIAGVSMIGACVHNIAQVCVAVLITGETGLFFYGFVLLIAGAVSGAVTGIAARVTMPRIAAALNVRCKISMFKEV
ncbi:MAG: Gx transporter family protein [Christensenellales bacterium]